jgi:NarL family two-component system response regulator LiaR
VEKTNNSGKITVLIVDDHQVVRQGLRSYLEMYDDIQVIGEAGDGREAIELAARLKPNVILMDLVMPVLDGISATSKIKSLEIGCRVIALTSFDEDDKVFPAIEAGASSYLLKDVSTEALVEAIRATHHGEARLHPNVMRKLMDQVKRQSQSRFAQDTPQLTEREIEVLRLVTQGKSNREIAQELVISEKTAKAHVSNILGKLGVEDRTQMAVYAIKHNLVDTGEL